MADFQLTAKLRDGRGKGPARRLRMNEQIPGVFYFGKDVNIPLSLDGHTFNALLRSKPNLIVLQIEDKEPMECIVRTLQRDPVTEKIVHVDFMGIQRGQKVRVELKLKLVGTPKGVKTGGGVLQQIRNSLDVEVLPRDIQRSVEIDVSELGIGDSILIRDLDFPQFKFLHTDQVAVASVIEPVLKKDVAFGDDMEPAVSTESDEENAEEPQS